MTIKSNLTKYGFCKQFLKLRIDEIYVKLAWDNIVVDVAYNSLQAWFMPFPVSISTAFRVPWNAFFLSDRHMLCVTI